MARRVFFSFHYQRDIWRANQVRNSWITQNRKAAGFWDSSLWEEARKKGDTAIKRMIDRGLENTSVTAVLIGAETASRKYVRYEIEQSLERGNGLLGVRIHGLKNKAGQTSYRGANPFDEITTFNGSWHVPLSRTVQVYDWKLNRGYNNFGSWVEKAAKIAGR